MTASANNPALHDMDIRIPLPAGDSLEGRLLHNAGCGRERGVVICPPHPLLAGNMDNNVVRAVAGRLARDMPVLLFNYQATGTSYKPAPVPLFEHWQALDAAGDYAGVIAESRATVTHALRFFKRCFLVGYSFGAFVACHCLKASCPGLVLVAPPVDEHDFPALPAEPAATVILAEKDGLLTGGGVPGALARARRVTITGSDHFFIGREHEVADEVARAIGLTP